LICTQVAGGTQYEYLAGKITSTGPGFADFARVQLTSSGVILADDATGANGDALGRAVAVGGSSNDVAAVAGTGGAHVYRGDATYASWTWVHARTTAGPAAVAVAGDLVFVSEDGGPAVALAVDGFAEVSRFESAAAGFGAAVAAATFGLQGRSYLLATTGGRELVCYEMTAPSSATFGEWNETSIANDGADDGFGAAVATDGSTIVVGAPDAGGGVGAAHVYNYTSGVGPTFVAALASPSPSLSERFGAAVAVSGASVLVGGHRGKAYVFSAATGALRQTLLPSGNDATAESRGLASRFGEAVALSGDVAVVGAPADDAVGVDGGRAHAYKTRDDGATWTELTSTEALVPRYGFAADYAGSAVAARCYGADARAKKTCPVLLGAPQVSDDGATGPGFAETFVAYPPDRYVASVSVDAMLDPPGLVSGDDDLTTTAAPSAAPSPGPTAAPAAANGTAANATAAARRRLSTESVDYAAAFNADETNGATFCAAVRLAAPSATGVEGCAAAAANAASATNHRVRVTYAVVFDTFALDDVDVFVNASLAAVKTEVAASMESGAFAAYLASEAAYRNASGDAAVLVLDVDVDRSVANVDALVLADVELSVATFSPTARPTGEEEDDDAFDEFVYVIYGAVLLLALTCCCACLSRFMHTGSRKSMYEAGLNDRRERGMVARVIQVASAGAPPRPESPASPRVAPAPE